MKTTIAMLLCLSILLCLLLCGGCSNKYMHERVWDSDGKLLKDIRVSVSSCLINTEARNIVAVTPEKFLFVGDLSQAPDPAAVHAVFSAIAEAFMPWWKGVGL